MQSRLKFIHLCPYWWFHTVIVPLRDFVSCLSLVSSLSRHVWRCSIYLKTRGLAFLWKPHSTTVVVNQAICRAAAMPSQHKIHPWQGYGLQNTSCAEYRCNPMYEVYTVKMSHGMFSLEIVTAACKLAKAEIPRETVVFVLQISELN